MVPEHENNGSEIERKLQMNFCPFFMMSTKRSWNTGARQGHLLLVRTTDDDCHVDALHGTSSTQISNEDSPQTVKSSGFLWLGEGVASA